MFDKPWEHKNNNNWTNIPDFSRCTTNQLYDFWKKNINDQIIYHGTNDKAWKAIQKDGFLSPSRRIWDDDFYELEALILKAGYELGFGTRREGQAFLTPEKSIGISYALRSPEAWSFFVEEPTWKTRNRAEAERSLNYHLIYGFFRNKPIAEVMKVLHDEKPDLINHSLLNEQELKRAQEIFDKYGSYFKDCKPVLFSFSSRFKDANYTQPFFSNFEAFKKIIHEAEPIADTFIVHACGYETTIEKDLSLSYLKKAERVYQRNK